MPVITLRIFQCSDAFMVAIPWRSMKGSLQLGCGCNLHTVHRNLSLAPVPSPIRPHKATSGGSATDMHACAGRMSISSSPSCAVFDYRASTLLTALSTNPGISAARHAGGRDDRALHAGAAGPGRAAGLRRRGETCSTLPSRWCVLRPSLTLTLTVNAEARP